MAVVTDKIKSVVDFLVKGFEPRETIFDEMAQEVEEDYPVQDNLALQPEYSFQQPSIDRSNDIKVVSILTLKAMKLKLWNRVLLKMLLLLFNI